MRTCLTAIGLIAAFAAAPAAAETVNMTAAMSAANEVPPVQSPANGSADVVVNTDTREMRWDVQVKDLSTPMTASHFHGPATSAQNGPVVIPIAKAGDQSPFKGSVTLTPEQMTDLLAGRWYVNVHTPTNPPGEIRGQVVKK
jgi:redox-regulated HSP33 family molecular chaperone